MRKIYFLGILMLLTSNLCRGNSATLVESPADGLVELSVKKKGFVDTHFVNTANIVRFYTDTLSLGQTGKRHGLTVVIATTETETLGKGSSDGTKSVIYRIIVRSDAEASTTLEQIRKEFQRK